MYDYRAIFTRIFIHTFSIDEYSHAKNVKHPDQDFHFKQYGLDL